MEVSTGADPGGFVGLERTPPFWQQKTKDYNMIGAMGAIIPSYPYSCSAVGLDLVLLLRDDFAAICYASN